MKDDNSWFTCVGLIVFSLVSVIVGAVMNGWVLFTLWGWFVTPILHIELPSIAMAIGFSLVVGMLVKQNIPSSGKKKETGELVVEIISTAVLSPLLTLFIGWIVLQFV